MLDVLITSVGRRAYLIDYFRKSLTRTGAVHAMNSVQTYAMSRADFSSISPPIFSHDYIPFLLDYCSQHKIRAVLSLFDPDIPILTHHSKDFERIGTQVIHAPEQSVEACNDKWMTYELARRRGLPCPKTYLTLPRAEEALTRNHLTFPVVVKPRWGMASIGVSRVDSREELSVLYRRTLREAMEGNLRFESAKEPERAVLIQEHASGIEHGLTVVNDLAGNFAAVLAVRKDEMRAGETFVGVSVDAKPFEGLAIALSGLVRHRGALSVDVFYDGINLAVTDLNCRISGHYPVSHLAGADLPTQIVEWLAGGRTRAELLSYQAGITVVKDIVPQRTQRGPK